MSRSAPFTIEVPRRDAVTDDKGLISRTWEKFFINVRRVLDPLGYERFDTILNNQASPLDIQGLAFNSNSVSQVIVEYLIQRVTVNTGHQELIESGIFILVFRPTSNDWDLVPVGTSGPDDSGVDFSVTSEGKVQYESSNIAGTPSISKICFRARTLSGKNYQYSNVGGG